MVKTTKFKRSDKVTARSKVTDDGEQPMSTFSQTMTLATLQDKIKRQPEMYKKEFLTQFGVFQKKLAEFKENPAKKDEQMDDYFKFMGHISGVYKEELAEYLSNELINMLQQYYSIMNPAMRLTLVTCLRIMRGKDVVGPSLVIPVFLKLFRCEDKILRKFLHTTIVTDLKKLNSNHKVMNINRKI
jgi:protein SDA1